MLLVFLTPRQALSSHPCIFSMILWESMNFQVAGTGDQTADPWVTNNKMITLFADPRTSKNNVWELE